jgi:hypothetical protein
LCLETHKHMGTTFQGIQISTGGNAETLMQMNVEQISLDLKEKEERDSANISQMTMVDIVQVDKCMIKPSAQYVPSTSSMDRWKTGCNS